MIGPAGTGVSVWPDVVDVWPDVVDVVADEADGESAAPVVVVSELDVPQADRTREIAPINAVIRNMDCVFLDLIIFPSVDS